MENKCPNCNENIQADWKYCKNCGYEIKNNNDIIKNYTEKEQSQEMEEKKNPGHTKKFWITIILILSIFFIGVSFIIFKDEIIDIKNSIIRKDIEKVKSSVVKIVVYNDDNQQLSTGSGVCVFEDNMIITNFHVIEGASKIEIITDANQTYDITKIDAVNKKQDLALISGNFKLQSIILGNTDSLSIGQSITAIGSPKGQLNTMSTGIISNINNNYDICISTPISPGSSGGALLNEKNQLIGITYATYSSDDAQNLNYAININYIEKLYHSLEIHTCKRIDESNVNNYITGIGYSEAFEYSNTYYSIENLSVWKSLTDTQTKFSNLLTSKTDGKTLQGIFSSFSSDDRYTIVELYKQMLEYERKFVDDIGGLTAYEAIMDTNIIPKYEFAMIMTDYYYTNDIESAIRRFPMEEGEDIFLRLMYGKLSGLSNSQYKSLANFIFTNCDNKGKIAFFKLFGYEISYDSNGKVNKVSWYY